MQKNVTAATMSIIPAAASDNTDAAGKAVPAGLCKDFASNVATLTENIAVIRRLQDKTFKYSLSLCFYAT